ncbi:MULTISPECIES: hypothetical protein [Gordonibacter]|uniref:ABC transporter permease n=1 Tax=Gordonibacter faecis TaxID=3047475 RepID=A0ABT7DQ54_9ACTN|nr:MULTISPECIES: hypothetical protein [unclassified Gordonibacter]MDJ1651684.1 hypothetical protein [Gordonibacter sp. KGMB12511]HIW77107.1 hypothetical protein [Candidatus Gordonibacter avicola]
MTKFKVAVRYVLKKLLKQSALFVVCTAIGLAALQLLFSVLGYGFVSFSGVDSFIIIFLIFWTVITFGKDAGFFLQSGLTRWEMFLIFALAVVAEAFLFALLSVVLALVMQGLWPGHSLLYTTGSFVLTVFIQVFLLNFAVASCALAATVLQRRIGTGWTAVVVIGLFFFVTIGLPALFSLFIGGIEAYGTFMASLMGSPYAPALPAVLYLVVSLAALALTWLLLRRANADRFAAGR